jgi:uncharacterized Fe-S center protein
MMKKMAVLFLIVTALALTFIGCDEASPISSETSSEVQGSYDERELARLACNVRSGEAHQQNSLTSGTPIVYMTTDISSEGLMAIYKALEVTPSGNIAVKVHTGESPNSNHLRPELIRELVQSLDAAIVETNSAYGGRRASTARHLQLAADHGFTAIAPVDIMDGDGDFSIPVRNGTHLQENFVGNTFADYDYYVVLSHFKGHQMGGFGGAIKNASVGFASARGKSWIHSAGAQTTGFGRGTPQNHFLESMAESALSIHDYIGDNILYINVMNRLSVDCDCVANPTEPDMHDIGILASFDPVALDQACVDLVFAAPDGASLIERIQSRNGLLTLEHAEAIGLGSRQYTLVSIDN